MQDNKIVIVNHGKQFGCVQWLTFHCPKCSNNLGTNKEQECSRCGTLLKKGEKGVSDGF